MLRSSWPGWSSCGYPRGVTKTLGLIGDERGHRSHLELNALRVQLVEEFDVESVWLPTDSAFDVAEFDGIWLVPGSPYRDELAVLHALGSIRALQIPFLGTCGGMQYAVIEFLRTECGVEATHAESDGARDDNAVVPLACSLDGEAREVVPTPGSRFSTWSPEPFVGMHFCSFAPSAQSVERLQAAGVVVGATGEDAGAEVLEFPGHPFFITSLFQPQVGALDGAPVHPLIRAFMSAAKGNLSGEVVASPTSVHSWTRDVYLT